MKARRFAEVVAFCAFAVALPAAAGAVAPVAPSGHVQVLQSSAVSPRARRCLTRIREELTAGGFDVTVSEFGAGGDALWMMDPPSPHDGSLAAITLIGNPDEGAAEVWIVDGVAGGRAAVRRLLVPAGSGAHDDEVLAIRTLEFLRASALELARSATPAQSTAPQSVPTAVPVAVTAEPVRAAAPVLVPGPQGPVSFELGLCLLEGSRTLGTAYLPLLRLRAELRSLLEARLTVATLGTRPRLTTQDGTASVGYTFGLVELRAAFRRGHVVRPALGVGGGVLLVQVDGTGNWPYEGLRGQRWAGLFDVGAGLTIVLGRRLAVAAEAHGQIAGPYPTVQFSHEEAARIGRPTLLTTLSLVTPL